MKVLIKFDQLKNDNLYDTNCEWKICRNLSRIMDVKVVNVNENKHTLSIIYENPKTVSKVIDELRRIGCPIKYTIKTSKAELFRRLE